MPSSSPGPPYSAIAALGLNYVNDFGGHSEPKRSEVIFLSLRMISTARSDDLESINGKGR